MADVQYGPRDLTENSLKMGVMSYTIQTGPVAGYLGTTGTANGTGSITFTTKPVKSCYIQQYSGTQIYMNFERAATAAATSAKLVSTGGWIPVPVDDLAKLNFIGTAADVVQIMWRA